MPLFFMNPGEDLMVKKIGGKGDTRQFLENLGFVQGGHISIVSKIAGNVIVQVKDSRVALSREMAEKIIC